MVKFSNYGIQAFRMALWHRPSICPSFVMFEHPIQEAQWVPPSMAKNLWWRWNSFSPRNADNSLTGEWGWWHYPLTYSCYVSFVRKAGFDAAYETCTQESKQGGKTGIPIEEATKIKRVDQNLPFEKTLNFSDSKAGFIGRPADWWPWVGEAAAAQKFSKLCLLQQYTRHHNGDQHMRSY